MNQIKIDNVDVSREMAEWIKNNSTDAGITETALVLKMIDKAMREDRLREINERANRIYY